MDAIRTCLAGPKDYEAGSKLSLIHGADNLLKKIFREPASPFKKKKLEQALRALITHKKEKVKKIEVSKETAIKRISTADRKGPEGLDGARPASQSKWGPGFQEMRN